jgi:acyl-CoA thioesterase-2
MLDVREVTPTDVENRVFTDCVWVRSAVALADDAIVQRCALAYLSDLGSGFGQQARAVLGMGGPSIDHAMWFHDPIRADEWVLLDLQPLKAGYGRGTYHGSLRSESGTLGATIAQETLLIPVP